MKVSEQLRIRCKVNDSLRRLLALLSSGKAYTLIELSKSSKTSKRKTEEILKDLATMEVVQVRKSRKRTYFFIPDPTSIRYIKKLALSISKAVDPQPQGMKYARHCYNHLAGYAGVKLEEALVNRHFIVRQDTSESNSHYKVTPEGWEWFAQFGIHKNNIEKKGNRLTKQCLDFSERKSHLGGKLGDALLYEFLEKGWVSQVPGSREIKFTEIGKRQMMTNLGISIH